ncbi:unnamed protein product [Dracunculus medinensis]|uniref:Protein amnionless n=1 Tax=Dracunculus medinensis TaxID=318479 RepID=A0A158Q6G2_DRAME|nr:unnamed protein product [Dracunculus medinensis]
MASDDVYFVDTGPRSFFNGSNWWLPPMGQNNPVLHAARIPSNEDIAVMDADNAGQMLVETSGSIKSLEFSNQNFSAKSFDHLLNTVEMRFQFLLGIEYNSEHDRSNESPKSLVKLFDDSPAYDNLAGQFNKNLEYNVMAAICKYETCTVRNDNVCDNTIKPVGHCCNICGSLVNFKSLTVDFNKMRLVLRNFELNNDLVKQFNLSISFLRTDNEDHIPHYQIVVLNRAKDCLDHTIDSPFKKSLDLTSPLHVFDVEEFHSIARNKYGALISASNIFILLSIVIFALALMTRCKKVNINFNRLHTATSHSTAVYWAKKKSYNDEQLELMNNDQAGPSNDYSKEV